jgi:hypothetical protein
VALSSDISVLAQLARAMFVAGQSPCKETILDRMLPKTAPEVCKFAAKDQAKRQARDM